MVLSTFVLPSRGGGNHLCIHCIQRSYPQLDMSKFGRRHNHSGQKRDIHQQIAIYRFYL